MSGRDLLPATQVVTGLVLAVAPVVAGDREPLGVVLERFPGSGLEAPWSGAGPEHFSENTSLICHFTDEEAEVLMGMITADTH